MGGDKKKWVIFHENFFITTHCGTTKNTLLFFAQVLKFLMSLISLINKLVPKFVSKYGSLPFSFVVQRGKTAFL